MTSPEISDQAVPSTRHMVTSLIISLNRAQHQVGSESVNLVSIDNKPALLTLHILFPNELLPALDLLDRGLVTRLHIVEDPVSENEQPDPSSEDPIEPTDVKERKHLALYTVRSAQPPPRSKHAVAVTPTTYLVHLSSWSCSCPAFAFAAFPAESTDINTDTELADENEAWRIGGLSIGNGVAVCKHLLACVLAEWGTGSDQIVEERGITLEEVAGWAAGWGD